MVLKSFSEGFPVVLILLEEKLQQTRDWEGRSSRHICHRSRMALIHNIEVWFMRTALSHTSNVSALSRRMWSVAECVCRFLKSVVERQGERRVVDVVGGGKGMGWSCAQRKETNLDVHILPSRSRHVPLLNLSVPRIAYPYSRNSRLLSLLSLLLHSPQFNNQPARHSRL